MNSKEILRMMLANWLASVAGSPENTNRLGAALNRIVSLLGHVESFGSSLNVWEMNLRLHNGKRLKICLTTEPTSYGSTQ